MSGSQTQAQQAGALDGTHVLTVPQAVCTVVEFPGVVRNVDASLELFGGASSVESAVSSETQCLKLSFRPSEPTAHPLYGDVQQTQGHRLLLRLSRPRGSDGPVRASIAAMVQNTIRFRGLSDFQYIASDPTYQARPTGPMPASRAEPSGERQPFLLIPPVFMKTDLPLDYAFKQHKSASAPQTEARHEAVQLPGIIQVVSFFTANVPQPPARSMLAAVAPPPSVDAAQAGAVAAATVPPPSAPMASDKADAPGSAAPPELLAAVASLLQRQRVWHSDLLLAAAQRSLSPRAPLTSDKLYMDRLLTRECYKFKSGPWRMMHIVRGYDPRTDPQARRYQVAIYRLNPKWLDVIKRRLQQGQSLVPVPLMPAAPPHNPADTAAALASVSAAVGDTEVVRGLSGDTAASGPPPGPQPAAGAGEGCAPDASRMALSPAERLHASLELPCRRVTLLQLSGVPDDHLQHLLAAAPPPGLACSETTGWLTAAEQQEVQSILTTRFGALLASLPQHEHPNVRTTRGGIPHALALALAGTSPAPPPTKPPGRGRRSRGATHQDMSPPHALEASPAPLEVLTNEAPVAAGVAPSAMPGTLTPPLSALSLAPDPASSARGSGGKRGGPELMDEDD